MKLNLSSKKFPYLFQKFFGKQGESLIFAPDQVQLVSQDRVKRTEYQAAFRRVVDDMLKRKHDAKPGFYKHVGVVG